MTVTYRLLHPNEEDAAVELWMRVLDTEEYEARQTFRDFHDEPQRFHRAHVAIADNGHLLATVCYWLRTIRDSAGEAVRIGHLFHVATEPTARGQGHATHLLANAVDALRAADCEWAILSARQDAAALYTRAGWQPAQRTYWRGTYAAEGWNEAQRHLVQLFDPRREEIGWTPIAAAYARANAQQAGSLIRTDDYWSGYAAWMFGLYLDDYQAVLLTIKDSATSESIRGYALVNFYEQGFVVSEIAGDPDDLEVLRGILNAIVAEARQRNIPLRGQLTIPADTATLAILQQFFGTTLHAVDDMVVHSYPTFMVRPIGDPASAPFMSPGALFWPLDAY
jgi:ribosomal protein S18 acetylase RimI-like enzyme